MDHDPVATGASSAEHAGMSNTTVPIDRLTLHEALAAIASDEHGSPGAGSAGVAMSLAAACLSKATAITLKHDVGNAALLDVRTALAELARIGLITATGDAQAFAESLRHPGKGSLRMLLRVEGDAHAVRARLTSILNEAGPLMHPSVHGDVVAARALLGAAGDIFGQIQRETLEAIRRRQS